MIYLLDTNIISYILRGDNNIRSILMGKIDAGHTIQIPVVTFYEVKRGIYRTSKEKQIRFRNFVKTFKIANMSIRTFSIAAQIYDDLSAVGQIIEDDDIFIGATAVEKGAVLVTNNPKHFSRIQGLHIEIWK